MGDQDKPTCFICGSEQHLNHYVVYGENDWRPTCDFCWESIHDGMYDRDDTSDSDGA